MSTKKTTVKKQKGTESVPLFRLFLHCGIAGWCMEILYTACKALQRHDFQLKGNTSLWMFPIYGCAAFLRPLFRITHKLWLPLRGCLYALLIFSGEFTSGMLLAKKEFEPWDYSRHRFRIGPHIRLDFLPNWFLAGLFYEKFTLKGGFRKL